MVARRRGPDVRCLQTSDGPVSRETSDGQTQRKERPLTLDATTSVGWQGPTHTDGAPVGWQPVSRETRSIRSEHPGLSAAAPAPPAALPRPPVTDEAAAEQQGDQASAPSPPAAS